MKPRTYVETSVASFYFEVRPEAEMVARREWTRTFASTRCSDCSPHRWSRRWSFLEATMTKPDPGLVEVRRVRERISRELDNDPARIVAHYIERQQHHQGPVLHGPEQEPAPSDPADPTSTVPRSARPAPGG